MDGLMKSRNSSARFRGQGQGRGRGRGRGWDQGRAGIFGGRGAGILRQGLLRVNSRPSSYKIAKASLKSLIYFERVEIQNMVKGILSLEPAVESVDNLSFNRAKGLIWRHDLFEDSMVAAGLGVETGTKLYISNLDFGVSNEDIKGSAEVVYARRSDAIAAVKRYNNVQLDGKPMKIEIIGNNLGLPVTPRVNVVGGAAGRGKRTVVMTKVFAPTSFVGEYDAIPNKQEFVSERDRLGALKSGGTVAILRDITEKALKHYTRILVLDMKGVIQISKTVSVASIKLSHLENRAFLCNMAKEKEKRSNMLLKHPLVRQCGIWPEFGQGAPSSSFNQVAGLKRDGFQRGRGQGRGRGLFGGRRVVLGSRSGSRGGVRGRRRKLPVEKSAEQLDKELEKFRQKKNKTGYFIVFLLLGLRMKWKIGVSFRVQVHWSGLVSF
ncbi:hypothetical protein AXF42_Ash014356 [Apostasia shenzhenica]|uniref:Chromatin target of PRMT1 protein C-terminal domain-containing protein n=1 Tax=Apostasia shenzhenica TaxID=1088818 RepID=A0A2I0B0Y7_9ASPA|nr:hypothetical protein AXF42_Ash014356 [Apostasia shenzhenica]